MNKLILLVAVIFINFTSISYSQEIWVVNNENGQNHNLTQGDELKGCTNVSGEFSLVGKTPIRWEFEGGTSHLERPSLLFQTEGVHSITAIYLENGTEQSISASVEVLGIPSENDFTLSTTEGCVGTTVTFTASTDYDYASLRFIVDGQTIGNGGSHTFTQSGSYTVIMEGTTKDGCLFDVQKTNIISIIDAFDFDVTPLTSQSCSNQLVQTFTAVTSTDDVEFIWDFGDGSPTEVGASVTHTFNSSSFETFTVTVTGEKQGCTTTKEAFVALNVASELFEVKLPSTHCDEYTVEFSSNLPSEFNGQQITWKFSDGSVLNRTLPSTISKTFLTSNETVVVEADFQGCTETESFIVPALLPNTIGIIGEERFCAIPYDVPLSISNLGDLPSGYTLSWRSSDGQTSTSTSPVFTFNNNSSKTIELIATGHGITCTLDQITVRSRNLNTSIRSSNGFQNCEGTTSTFTARTTHFNQVLPNSEIASTSWELYKDGNLYAQSSDTDFTLTFTEHGNYSLTVIVENLEGCTATDQEDISIGSEITPTFDVDKSPVCNAELATFTNTTDLVALGIDPNDIQFQWNYGNGWVNSYHGSHTYNNTPPGPRNVQLRAIYNGCDSEVTTAQIIISPPAARFVFDLESECDINSLKIENTSIDATLDYEWTVNAGGNVYNFTSTLLEPAFYLSDKIGVNLQNGINYNVSLTAKTVDCEDIYNAAFTPVAMPTVDITWDNNSALALCANNQLTFSAGTGINDGNASVLWSFTKDNVVYNFPNSPITGANPTLTFIDIGEYTVRADVTFLGPDNCQSFDIKGGIHVFDIEVSDFDVPNPQICLTDPNDQTLQQFNITASINAHDPNLLENFSWKWEVFGDNNNTPLVVKEGFDPTDISDALDFEYDFNAALANQNKDYLVKFTLTSNACSYSYEHKITVTDPQIGFIDEDEHVIYDFKCDYITTTIDTKINSSKIRKPKKATYNWYLEDPDDGSLTLLEANKIGGNAIIFTIDSLEEGEKKLVLEVTDIEGCSVTDKLIINVPALPIGLADFTPTATDLACRGSIQFSDLADGSNGNSTPRYDANNKEIPIVLWVWNIKRGSDLDLYFSNPDDHLDYFFEAGEYKVTLMVEDEQGCNFTSDTLEISVGGVRGDFTISKRAGYAPFSTTLDGTPSYTSDNSGDINYIWFSGDGYSEITSSEFTYTYDSISLQDRKAIPGVIFEDERGCRYPANSQGEVTILTTPQRTITDIQRCINEGDTLLNVSDPTFIPANIDTTTYSYTGEVHYQWYVDGQKIDGATSEEVTFTYGKTIAPFTIDPDEENGRTYSVESWIDAQYVDKIEPTHSHQEIVAVRKDTFNVIFDPIPVAQLEDIAAVCLSEPLTLDGSLSNFGNYTRGEITSYYWEIENWGDTISSEPIIEIYLDSASTYKVTLTVSALNNCIQSTIMKDVEIKPLPVMDFSTEKVCLGYPNIFENNSTYEGENITADNIDRVVWYFDYEDPENEVVIEEISPSYSFNADGLHKVKLEIYTLNGCIDSLLQTIEVYELPTVQLTEDTFICIGESIALEVNGGNRYLWSTNETESRITVSPERDTIFYVEVYNEFNCLTLDSVQVNVIPSFEETITFFEACAGESIQLNGQLIDYPNTTEEILWSTGETTSSILVTESGTYTVSNTVTHSSGKTCLFTKEIEVEFRALPPELSADTVHCFIDGPLEIIAPIGSNYTYIWDSGETTANISVTDVGVYTVTITDNTYPTLCATTSSIEVFNPQTVANFTSNNACLGQISIIDGATSTSDHEGLPTEYIWDLGTYGDTITTTPILNFTFPDYGSHVVSLVVQPIDGCASESYTSNVTVYELPLPSFTFEDKCLNEVVTFNNTSTYQGILISNNTQNISRVDWDFNYNGDIPNFTNQDISPEYQYEEAGTFIVLMQITLKNGCTVSSSSEITIHALPTIVLTEDLYICYGDKAELHVEGGIAYQWLATDETTSSITVQPEKNKVYKVKVWNQEGCVDIDSVTVNVIPGITDEETELQICQGDEITLDGRIGDYEGVIENYSWSNGSSRPTIDVTEAGAYTVTNTVVHESGKECTFDRTFNVIVRNNPPEFSNPDTTFCFRTGGEIEITAPEGNKFLYLWEDTGETTQKVKREEEGVYEVRIIDTSYATECETNTSIQVVDLCPPQIFTPSAITPNHDNLNDEFLIRSRYALDLKLNIYNRWGEIIFTRVYKNSNEARQEGNGWDAYYRGKLVPGGVYTYTIDYISELDGSIHRDANSITVIR